ncbi:MAG: HD domain-containing protein [Thermoclostridium sp.]|nr:HD domain-containing protein [Thermoclostridium sp.]
MFWGISEEIGKNIVANNVKRESSLLKNACKSMSGERRYPDREKIPESMNIRPSFFHDADRIIHSTAYTRYIDKTQVFFLFENDHITHRVLHVQFVSKIARVIGRCLRLNEDLLEAIALGHDIGHVPYGHDGEKHLNAISIKADKGFFCHNAQGVRALMELENRGKGLNLTLQVLDGILCHNGEFLNRVYEPETNKTWDTLLEEYQKCWTVPGFDRKLKPMTLEGCVVRIADVIAYIGRDIEDAITVGLIERSDIPEDIVEILGDSNDKIINGLVTDLISNSFEKNYVTFSEEVFKALEMLLKFNYVQIYHNPVKKNQDKKIETMFKLMYQFYLSELLEKGEASGIYKSYISGMVPEYRANNSPERIVIDYLAGMTDDYFNHEFKKNFMPESYGMKIT